MLAMIDITTEIPILENIKEAWKVSDCKMLSGLNFFLIWTKYRAEESLYLDRVSLCNSDKQHFQIEDITLTV